MPTINQLRVERLAFFRELKRQFKAVETEAGKVDRAIERVLDRRLNVPETADLERVLGHLSTMAQAVDQFATTAGTGQGLIFN